MQVFTCDVYDSSGELVMKNSTVHIREIQTLGLEMIGAIEVPKGKDFSIDNHNFLNVLTERGFVRSIFPVNQRGRFIYFLNSSSDFR